MLFFTEEKLRKHTDEIRTTICRETKKIPLFKYLESECDGAHAPDFDDSAWENFEVGRTWGGYDKVAWFRSTVEVPAEWKGEKTVLRFLVGPRDGGGSTAETLLYVNGKPLQGIDIWHEEAWLPPEVIGDGKIHVALKAWSSVLKVPEVRRFKVAELACVDEAAEHYFYQMDTLLYALKELDENDFSRTELLKAMNASMHKVDFLKVGSEMYYASLREALTTLEARLAEIKEQNPRKPKVVTVGHSHIDMAWLWRLNHTREKASRTFSTVLHLMKQYPEYRFMHSSPQLYQFLKTDYPDIYAAVKERIASGEWEITGGMWVEPDTNLPSGESLIRQILFGKRFMRDEFGVETRVVWLPDVFGYTWSLPQIMKKSGIDAFMTTKISWSQFNRFPYDTFKWRGTDGTEILTHFITTPERDSLHYTYNGEIDPKSIKGIWDAYQQKEINNELLFAYGWGDGGGGPSKEMLEARRVIDGLPGFPQVETGKVEPYFERLAERVKDESVPVWDGELYLEYHRGTYTSQAALKKANRKADQMYREAEWLGSTASLLSGNDCHVNERLRHGWERMLLNQFHDVLPGSSIRQVNEDARADYEWVQSLGNEVTEDALDKICTGIAVDEDRVVVFNSLSHARTDLVEVSGEVEDAQPIEEGRYLALAEGVPAFGYETLQPVQHALEPMIVKPDKLENRYYVITLNAHGQLTSIYDKRRKREVLAEHATANVFQAFEDKPMEFDAWDIDIYYQEKMREITELTDARVIEEGPLRGVLRLTWTFFDSTITQDVTIYDHSTRIDFKTTIDWQEKQTLLKAAFPVNIRATRATYDIQFGAIERATHWNTSWDYARFEAVGHKWVDLSEGNYGVALLNDCKYGHDVRDHVLRLTLLKSSIGPDETADRGKHEFTYSLYPHEGDWKDGGVIEEAYALNHPLRAAFVKANPNGALPNRFSFVSCDNDHVVIETVKKAEDGDAIVVRVYESKQYRNEQVKLKFAKPIQHAVECNLIEEEERETVFDSNEISFGINPFEIKTFKVTF
ncbi:MAG TPA: alpha-mannosidase [Bacillales bacterium]|nr:alpha-mannosidase [Bacillales bacterium]